MLSQVIKLKPFHVAKLVYNKLCKIIPLLLQTSIVERGSRAMISEGNWAKKSVTRTSFLDGKVLQ